MLIEITDLTISLQDKIILKSLNFSLEEPQLVMIIGLNGSGKTTLIKTMLGFIPFEKGIISYDKKNIRSIPLNELAKKIAYMPQQQETRLEYTVLSFVIMGINPYLKFFALPDLRDKDRAMKILVEFGIAHLAERRMDQISGGEKQLAYLARARMQKTEWIFLDEPTAQLDYLRQHWLMNRLRYFAETGVQGIVVSVHSPDLVLQYAQRVLLINNEGIIQSLNRKDEFFEERLTEELNKVYDNKLKLAKVEEKYIYINQ